MAKKTSSVWVEVLAGFVAFSLSVIIFPVFQTLQNTFEYTFLTMFGVSLGLLAIAGLLHIIRRAASIKVLLALLGFAWLIIFTYITFPIFQVALI